MSEFYEFNSKGYLTTFAAWAEPFTMAIEHDYQGFHSGREIHTHLPYSEEYPRYIQFPIVFQQIDGKRMRDVLDMRGIGAQILISDRLKHLLEDYQITGWKTYPILLKDRKGEVIPGYSGFTVTGKGGELFLPGNKGWTSRYYEWYYWDSKTWDGSDFFCIGGWVFVTNRVKTLLTQNRIDAIEFIPIEDSILHLMDEKSSSNLDFVVFPDPPKRPLSFDVCECLEGVDLDTLGIIEDGLENKSLVSVENSLERIRLLGSNRLGKLSWFLGNCPAHLQTKIRVERVIALDKLFPCLFYAISHLDDACQLLLGSLDPDSFKPCDFGGFRESVSDIEEWDDCIRRIIKVLERSLKDVYNVLSDETKCYVGVQGKTSSVYDKLDESLSYLAKAIHVLTWVSK